MVWVSISCIKIMDDCRYILIDYKWITIKGVLKIILNFIIYEISHMYAWQKYSGLSYMVYSTHVYVVQYWR